MFHNPALALRRQFLSGVTLQAALSPLFMDKASGDPTSSPKIASPIQFGARGDDGLDHTDAMQQAIAHAAGGVVFLPPGVFSVRGDQLRLPPATALMGVGRGSVLKKLTNGTLLDLSGSSTRTRNGGIVVRDLILDGGDKTGNLARCRHAQDIVFENVWSRANNDVALEATELWDSRFTNCTWDWCSGGDGKSPAVLLRNHVPGEPANDNTNAICFTNCRWESFRDGALWLSDTGAQSMSQILITNCKMETSYVRGSFLKVEGPIRNVMIENLYLCGNSFDRSANSPVNLVELSPYAMTRVENVSVWLNASVARTVVRAKVGHPSCSIDNVWLDGSANPTAALIEKVGPVFPQVDRVGYLKQSPGVIEV